MNNSRGYKICVEYLEALIKEIKKAKRNVDGRDIKIITKSLIDISQYE